MTDPSASGSSSDPTPSPEAERLTLSQEQRLEALGHLAAAQLQQHGTITSTSTTRPETMHVHPLLAPCTRRLIWQRLPFWLAVIVVFAGAGIALWRIDSHAVSSSGQAPPRVVTIVPRLDDMGCPHDLAWSPSGKTLAVLGYDLDCPGGLLVSPLGNSYSPLSWLGPSLRVPGLINLYNTRTGGLIGQLHPDTFILPHITVPAAIIAALNAVGEPADHFEGINYTHLLWSSDGQRLAMTFYFYVVTGLSHGSQKYLGYAVEGVLLTDPAGQHVQVFLHPLSSIQPTALIWNLSTGQPHPASGPTQTAPTAFASLSPALDYRWSQTGTLAGDTPLTSSTSPTAPGALTPVGIPNGGSSFTLWQPGFLGAGLRGSTPGQTDLQKVFTFTTSVTAWSPNEQYLVESVQVTGVLTSPQTPAPDPSALAAYGWALAPRLPVRDAALQQAMGVADKYSYPAVGSGLLVAWRPDGRLLAVDTNTPVDAVTLYACATGQVVATLKPDTDKGVASMEQEANALIWSPNGSRLALYDTAGGVISLWSGSSLPHA